MDIQPSQDSISNALAVGAHPTLLGTTFLSAGPEAFGLISDAVPLATRHLLVAAGHDPTVMEGDAPLYGCEAGEPDKVARILFPMLDTHPILTDILRMNLGDCAKPQEHPLSRYCAMLVTAAVYEALNTSPNAFPEKNAEPERKNLTGNTDENTVANSGPSSEKLNDLDLILSRLSLNLPSLLDEFKNSLYEKRKDHIHMPVVSDKYFRVSLGACRVLPGENAGDWIIDICMAGNYRAFLLDTHGLASLWDVQTRPLAILSSPDVMGRRLSIRHREPFSILLLSGGLCDAGYTDINARQDIPVHIWRKRMRLEELLLRIIVSCDDEEEFGVKAARAFAGQAMGRDCISGAMTVISPLGGDYEAFRMSCQGRLENLEELLALLPEEFDPTRMTPHPPCGEYERAYVRDLFAKRPKYLQSTVAMLGTCITNILNQALTHTLSKGYGVRVQQEESTGQREDSSTRVLSEELVYDVFRQYDQENDQDRAQVSKNRRIIRQVLSSHWVTLRPVLMSLNPSSESEADMERCRRMYDSCLEMNHMLNSMLEERRNKLSAVETLLSDTLEVLRSASDDWIMGRGSETSFTEWLNRLSTDLPCTLDSVRASWQDATQRCRSLQTAYTAERETLFDYDTVNDRGFWHPVFQSIMEGKLSDTVWENIKREATAAEKEGAYGDMFDALRIISEQIFKLTQRIQSRAAEQRCVQVLSGEFEWQFACLRASVYGETSWHPDIESLLDEGTRNEFKAVVRRWQETEALQKRQKQAFGAYQDMYNSFIN